MGAVSYRNILIALALAGLLLALALASLPALAQSGCSGDPCVYYTPTATSTGTPTTVPGPGTPTAVPFPSAIPFPRPFYGVPTSIPVSNIPTANPNGYSPPTLSLPSPLALTYTPPPFATPNANSGVVTSTALATINTSLSISYGTPTGISGSGSSTNTDAYSGSVVIIEGVNGLVTDVTSYTTWLSGTVENLTPTDTFTIVTAPDWYAPALPRPMADVGWTFETLQTGVDEGRRYSLAAWSSFFGYVASLPFQFVKLLYQIVQFLGPLGLFLTWLLVMAPIVTYFRILLWIKNLFISLLNFIIKIISLLLSILGGLLKLVLGFFV